MDMIRSLLLMVLCAASLSAQVIINEVDADTPSTDTMEFVELYGTPNLSLSGLVLVFYNGSSDTVYNAIDLTGFSLDSNGFFLVGNAAVTPVPAIVLPNNSIQNGADAVALYADVVTNFPNGTAVTITNLVDALVYDTNDSDDVGLLVLTPGEPQVNEAGAGNSSTASLSRCLNGAGGALITSTYQAVVPTPGALNDPSCPTFTVSGSQDITNCGPILLNVAGANPNAELYNLVSIGCTGGNGPLLGVGWDAFGQLFLPLGTAPFHVLADASGNYAFSLTTPCAAAPVTIEVVTVEVLGGAIMQVTPNTACFPISL